MKKGLIAVAVIAAVLFYSKPWEQDNSAPTSGPTLEQSVSDFKDSVNALSEAMGTLSDEVKGAAQEAKDGIESVTGVGSVSRLLDGGNRFAFDCAVDWFTQIAGVELEEYTLTIGEYQTEFVERQEQHVSSEYEDMGHYTLYWVGFPITLTDSKGEPLDDVVFIDIQLSEDNWGYYHITKLEDIWNIFTMDIGWPFSGTYTANE